MSPRHSSAAAVSLQCHEEETIFLMDSPCSSTPSLSTTIIPPAQHHQIPQQQRYYLPFGQNANELSMERKRLHRISLQAAAQAEAEECRLQQRTAAAMAMVELRTGGGGQRHQAGRGGGGTVVLDTPKNGAKVLGPIDINIPTNRLVVRTASNQRPPPVVANNHQPQQQQHRPFHPQPPAIEQQQQPTEMNGQQQQLLAPGTRKRRAAADDDGEAPLNTKERIWVCADLDRAIHIDGRCLQSLLEAEKHVQVGLAQIQRRQQQGGWDGRANGKGNDALVSGGELNNNYGSILGGGRTMAAIDQQQQLGVDEWARKRLIEWFEQVCNEESADCVVFPLAVAYLDRMLAARFIPRRNLQALGSACLLLASKMKAPCPIMAERIAELTDGALCAEELLDWEMVVLNHLNWNLVQSTPFEFFDQLLVRSPMLEMMREDFAQCMKQMQKVISVATQLPSVQASVCLLYCALHSQRQHLMAECERSIRLHLGYDPVNFLDSLLENVAQAMGATTNALLAADVRKLADRAERQRSLQPPTSKRMSFDHSSTTIVSTDHSIPFEPLLEMASTSECPTMLLASIGEQQHQVVTITTSRSMQREGVVGQQCCSTNANDQNQQQQSVPVLFAGTTDPAGAISSCCSPSTTSTVGTSAWATQQPTANDGMCKSDGIVAITTKPVAVADHQLSPPPQPDDESSRGSSSSSAESTTSSIENAKTEGGGKKETKVNKMANDSGYRSLSEATTSPPAPLLAANLELLNRKAKDFGPLW